MYGRTSELSTAYVRGRERWALPSLVLKGFGRVGRSLLLPEIERGRFRLGGGLARIDPAGNVLFCVLFCLLFCLIQAAARRARVVSNAVSIFGVARLDDRRLTRANVRLRHWIHKGNKECLRFLPDNLARRRQCSHNTGGVQGAASDVCKPRVALHLEVTSALSTGVRQRRAGCGLGRGENKFKVSAQTQYIHTYTHIETYACTHLAAGLER